MRCFEIEKNLIKKKKGERKTRTNVSRQNCDNGTNGNMSH